MNEYAKLKSEYQRMKKECERQGAYIRELETKGDLRDETVENFIAERPHIREKIVGGYVDEVKSGLPPAVLAEAGEAERAAPPKPATLQEAGEMALKLL